MGVSRKSESKNRFVSPDSQFGAIEEVTEPAYTNYDRGHEHQESGNDGRCTHTLHAIAQKSTQLARRFVSIRQSWFAGWAVDLKLRCAPRERKAEGMSMSVDSAGEEYIPESAQLWKLIECGADLNGGIQPITSTLVKT
jgi:hypothetical protein